MFKLSTSVLHRYEIFEICNELNKLNVLETLYSTYPKFEILKYNIPKSKIKSYVIYELLSRTNDYFWSKNFYFSKLDLKICDLFDNRISKLNHGNIDIFYGNGGMCLQTFRKIKNKTMKVFHSASMHIATKKRLLIDIGYNANEIVNPLMENKYLSEIEIADYVVCTSDHTYDSYLENGINESKLILNHSGIDVNRFFYEEKEEINDGKFRFLFVGNFSLRKGGLKLIEAYKKIRNRNTELIIAGTIDFTLKNQIKNYENYDDIRFIGKIKNKDLYKIYSKCHLLCLLASEEGFAKVLGEAMACGLPLLCSKNSGGSYFIREKSHGAVIENLELANIADMMKSFLDKIDLIKNNKFNLSNYAKKNFSWEVSVKKLTEKLSSKL